MKKYFVFIALFALLSFSSNTAFAASVAWRSTVTLTNTTNVALPKVNAAGNGTNLAASWDVQANGTTIQISDQITDPFVDSSGSPVVLSVGQIPFTLTNYSGGSDLNAYYTQYIQNNGGNLSSGWGQYLINTLSGATSQTAMFYIKYDGTHYSIADGTQDYAGNPSSPMLIPADFPQGTYTLTGSVNGTPVNVILIISNSAGWTGSDGGSGGQVLTNQTITITTPAPASATYNSTFPVAATSTSGLPVGITTTGGCSIASSTVTMTSGTDGCTVHYNQVGNVDFNPATEVTSYTGAIKVLPTISVTNSPVVYNGFPQSAVVAGSIPGNVQNIYYNNGLVSMPTDIGTYSVTADFISVDTNDYYNLLGASAGNFVISSSTIDVSTTTTPTTTTTDTSSTPSASGSSNSSGGGGGGGQVLGASTSIYTNDSKIDLQKQLLALMIELLSLLRQYQSALH